VGVQAAKIIRCGWWYFHKPTRRVSAVIKHTLKSCCLPLLLLQQQQSCRSIKTRHAAASNIMQHVNGLLKPFEPW